MEKTLTDDEANAIKKVVRRCGMYNDEWSGL
jgi:hypothetical protein